MARKKSGGRPVADSAQPTADDFFEKEKKRKKRLSEGAGNVGSSATQTKVKVPKPRAGHIRVAEDGQLRFRFVKIPPEEYMYEADPNTSPRLFKFLVDKGHVQEARSYRASKVANAKRARRKGV